MNRSASRETYPTFGLVELTSTCHTCEEPSFYTQAATLSLSLGLGSVVVGSGLMIGGAMRRGKYKAWAKSRATSSIVPTFAVGASGVHFGIAGHF